VIAESEPQELSTSASSSPSAVRPALAITAAEEVETIRRVLLEAATSTTRETWATCTCPECGKGFRQEISVPDHGARIKAVETLLREGLGRVGVAEVIEPKMPTSVDEVKNLSWDELNLSLRCRTHPRSGLLSNAVTTRFARNSRSGDRTSERRSPVPSLRSADRAGI
jgi:hypothetical protein